MNPNDIPRHWPPHADAHTGFMTLHGEVPNEFFISLKDLHEPAWWTGVRFLCPAGEAVTFTVSIVNGSGESLTYDSHGSWTQVAGEWQPFTWAIPAAMAHTCEYQLRVRYDGPAGSSQWVKRDVAFHELDGLNPRYIYIFTRATHEWPLYKWDGNTKKIDKGISHRLRDHVRIVPPMTCLL